MKINYIVGDATNPQGPGNKIITHCCNDIGGWGRGFVVALSKKWKEPEGSYREWYRNKECQGIGEITPFELGEVQFVEINHFTQVANLIGQNLKHKVIPTIKKISLLSFFASSLVNS